MVMLYDVVYETHSFLQRIHATRPVLCHHFCQLVCSSA